MELTTKELTQIQEALTDSTDRIIVSSGGLKKLSDWDLEFISDNDEIYDKIEDELKFRKSLECDVSDSKI